VKADNTKVTLYAIPKGKTRRAEQIRLGSNPAIVRDHSLSGWTTKETFARYLDWLAGQYREKITPDCPLDLVLDCYAIHRSAKIRDHAASLAIRLWFIPAGHTDELQPLDRAVFGALKVTFRRRLELECRQHPQHRVTKSGAIEILIQIWNGLGDAAISGGWQICADDFGLEEAVDGIDREE
jgi:hypothetical protein